VFIAKAVEPVQTELAAAKADISVGHGFGDSD
jgi:hypothetical protein